jgi:ABC-2 type transport system permease protein
MSVVAIAALNLRRMLRDRSNAFFLLVFPLLMIMVLGMAFGDASEPRLMVVAPSGSPMSADLLSRLQTSKGVEVREVEDRAVAVEAVEKGRAEAVVLIPADYDHRVAVGDAVGVSFLSRADRAAQQVSMIVRAAVDAEVARLQAARTVGDWTGIGAADSMRRVDTVALDIADVPVITQTAGSAAFPASLGRFDIGASQQLLLFIFITSMTAATALIETRRLGVTRRMLATPTRLSSIVAGEALGRIAVAALQGMLIMTGASLFFGVSWGDPIAAGVLMLSFAVVAGAAGMLLGSLASSGPQAIASGLLVGLGLSALGGTMMPLEFFSPTLLRFAHLTPHAWAADGFAALVRHDGTLVSILPQLGVLAVYATVLLALAAWSMRWRILQS